VSNGALVGWAGTFGSWHGAEVAVEALAYMPPSVHLLMVGDGKGRPACEQLAARLGVAQRLEVTGALDRRDALRRLDECDVLISPHTPLRDQAFFGSPTKIFEYMALAKPIVVSQLGQLGDLFQDQVNGRLVTPGDAREVAEAVVTIIGSADHGRALGAAARREVEQKHTWSVRADAILRALRLVVPESR
jgi:glycosyltransferase involved in cell wall biosynthesis